MADPRDVPTVGLKQRYTAPAFGFGASVQAVLGGKDDVFVIATSIINILKTPKGTVPYDPRIGSEIPYLIFEILDDVTVALIRYYTFKDVTEQEPRIRIVQVFARRDEFDENKVIVELGWQIIGDPEARVFGTPVPLSRDSFGGI